MGVPQLQTQPQRLARRNTLGRMGDQFGTDLRVLHHGRGIAAPQHTARARQRHACSGQRQQQKGGTAVRAGDESGHGRKG